MRARSTELKKESLPTIFQHKDFKGQFYRLDEPVFNTLSVIRALAEPRIHSILPIKKSSLESDGQVVSVESKSGGSYNFLYKKVVLIAGQGNEDLLSRFDYTEPKMQLRPLKMVVMRDKNINDMIYAHCLGASVNPRITITSHRDNHGNIVWYMGGQLAEEGVGKSDAELVLAAKNELADLIPWLKLKDAEWGVLEIDRAEIKKEGMTRPDSFSVEENNNVIAAWPTKMALSPALADTLLGLLESNAVTKSEDKLLPEWSSVEYADFPWNEDVCWQRGKV
jgi:hypothetical protein